MLSTLRIKNFALIDELELELGSGLNIITGETGAGKSIVIGALQLLTGRRADRSLIRKGADTCEIGGIFEFDASDGVLSDINAILESSGVPQCEAGQLIIRRIFKANSARNYINSSPVTLNLVNQVGDMIVDMHGPYDHQLLLQPKKQLTLLDAFAGLEISV